MVHRQVDTNSRRGTRLPGLGQWWHREGGAARLRCAGRQVLSQGALALFLALSTLPPAEPVGAAITNVANIVVPSDRATVEGTLDTVAPFDLGCCSQAPMSGRYQQAYSASAFSAAGPQVIRQIKFRPDARAAGPFSTTLSNVQINLSTTSKDPEALSTTFAENVGADDTVVHSGPLPLSSAFAGPAGGPKDFDIVIPLTTPFTYDPRAGNLLLDVRNFSGEMTTPFDVEYRLDDQVSNVWTWSYWRTDVNTPIGTWNTGGLVTLFVVEGPGITAPDITAPTLTASRAPAANAAGWNNTDVTVVLAGADEPGGSGVGRISHSVNGGAGGTVQAATATVTLSGEGANQSVTATATDNAGNTSAPITVGNINIDKTPPTLSIGGILDGATYRLGAAPTPNCTATDDLSGLAAPCSGNLARPATASGAGTYTYTATATDRAGNTTTKTATYRVVYAGGAFLRPIAGQRFGVGSRFPVTLQLTNFAGAPVPSARLTLTANGAPASSRDPANAGGAFRFDPKARQYVFNLSTAGLAPGPLKLVANLDDGTTREVTIALK